MTAIPQILVTGLTLGSMYALAALGLALAWSALRMLNMAHGALLALGGYMAYGAFNQMGLSMPLSFLLAALVGALMGWLVFWGLVKPLLSHPDYETSIIIATVGLGIVVENTILNVFGGQPLAQPLSIEGSTRVLGVAVPLQNIAILCASLFIVFLVQIFLQYTRSGQAVRACSQQQQAALLVGVPVMWVFSVTMALAGALTASSGVLLSSITQLSPTLGADPMLKAFVMCVLAGLGNVSGAIIAAFALALIEVAAQYWLGARWGFPVLLLLVMGTLIWRPSGLFSTGGRARQ